MDMATGQWARLPTAGFSKQTPPELHRLPGLGGPPQVQESEPSGRYLCGAALVPQKGGVGGLSMLVFGGVDSVGAYLDDSWELRLDGLANSLVKFNVSRRDDYCGWRLSSNGTTASQLWSTSCTGTAAISRPCNFTDVLRMGWCRGQYQSIAYL
jgi:hypothetical protein